MLRLRHALLTEVADAAAARGAGRQIRTELRYVSAVSVTDLCEQANEIAQRSRELNALIQEANWTIDLIED